MPILDNKDIANLLNEYSQLYELHNGNPFKVKSIAAAAFNIKKIHEPLTEMSLETLSSHPQIGKSMGPKIHELIQTGHLAELDELIAQTPEGVRAILSIKGLGPKKVETLWRNYNICSIADLLDACRENRLVEIKGFGYKTQAQIQSNIEFKFNNEGKFHWAKLQGLVTFLNEVFEHSTLVHQYQVAGDYRRLNDIVETLEYVVECKDGKALLEQICSSENFKAESENSTSISCWYIDSVKVLIHLSDRTHFAYDCIKHSATEAHLNLIHFEKAQAAENETAVYASLNLPYIIPEWREGLKELEKLELQDDLIKVADLKGCIHNHSTYSDGIHTLEEMAVYAQHMGLEYLAICDHSQTAAYAGGLRPEKVLEQWQEIDKLNQKLSPFRILRGIESDILNDGQLDYNDDLLKLFDIVVASVHSPLSMSLEKANARLSKAIENPYTDILGHPTGRLLLLRSGYPIDHAYIIDACVANQVVIELNAHPYRLDLDWRWIDYAINKGALISINPDAHQKEGMNDMVYGVQVARKGYLTPKHCLNAMDLNQLLTFLSQKRQRRA